MFARKKTRNHETEHEHRPSAKRAWGGERRIIPVVCSQLRKSTSSGTLMIQGQQHEALPEERVHAGDEHLVAVDPALSTVTAVMARTEPCTQ